MTLTIKANQCFTLDELDAAAAGPVPVELDEEAWRRVRISRETLEKFVENDRVIYGVNTSTGGFVDWLVPVSMARELQENLINAVATNVGQYLDDRTVHSIMLSRIVSLARGNSAISPENLEKLIRL
ncbi:hypothetical protein ADL34_10305 [Streptomyces sp. NRRL WC-3605]|nr:aromatic amino acid lyase [Streptomyces sp. NRRL WC-3605]KUL71214.1 hypothetical protein ADL33_27535 [Streptomyces sp. NRRL WC-3604]KUL76870.1 hypothetical protein ADL34_10305 [Streptomyces sp. NRRL WC-3605]